jgi:hypothetical protein
MGKTGGKKQPFTYIKQINQMTNERLKTYVDRQILRKQGANEYRLRRPLQITVTKKIIDYLKLIYPETQETGGILECEIAGNGTLVINNFIQVPNNSFKNYNYNPNLTLWNAAILDVLSSGNLPIALHTHPIRLGIEHYDERRSTFYLKSSKADKAVARQGITSALIMPEAIFTRDEGLGHGFGLVFYTGTIFPASITALSTVSYISAGLSLLTFKKNKGLSAISAGVGLFDFFFRRPRYTLERNGDYVVKLAN